MLFFVINSKQSFKCAGKLIGAGRRLYSASRALKACDDVFDAHTDDESGYALGIACATVCKRDAFDDSVFNRNVYLARAGADRLV